MLRASGVIFDADEVLVEVSTLSLNPVDVKVRAVGKVIGKAENFSSTSNFTEYSSLWSDHEPGP